MNIVDMVVGFVVGGAIGGGALYALQQGKIAELAKQFQKTRSALNETESELKDTKGQLKLLDVSEARIRDIEGTYREEVAKLQLELDEAKAKLQETVLPVVSPNQEAEYQTRIQEIQQDYENQLLELRQTHQTQIQELLTTDSPEIEPLPFVEEDSTPAAFVPESPFEESPSPQFPEPWDDMSDAPRADFSETLIETPAWEESTSFSSEFTPELEVPESLLDIGEFTSEGFDGFVPSEEFTPEPEVAESLLGAEPWDDMSDAPRADFSETLIETPAWEESTSFSSEFTPELEVPESLLDIGEFTSEGFDTFVPGEEFTPEPEVAESLLDIGEFTSEGFNTFVPSEEFTPEPEVAESLLDIGEFTSEGFNGFVPGEEFTPEPEVAESLLDIGEESLSEVEMLGSWMDSEEIPSELEAIDRMPTIAEPPISHEFDLLDRPSSEEAIDSISSLEDLAIEEEEVLSASVSSPDTNFYDLFPTEAEQAETSVTQEIPLSIDDLFGDSSELSSLELPKAETNGHEELDLDFLNMLDDSETGSINSLSSDEDLESSFDELFSDDLFSDWSSGTPDHASKIESR